MITHSTANYANLPRNLRARTKEYFLHVKSVRGARAAHYA